MDSPKLQITSDNIPPITIREISYDLETSIDKGLKLKKDQGFRFLDHHEQAFLISYVYGGAKKKRQSYLEAMEIDESSLTEDELKKASISSSITWARIEEKMGGPQNIIKLLGVDIVEIITHTRRLMNVKKLTLDKEGTEHYSDDGNSQMRALEFLAKISGNYSEEENMNNRPGININFNMNKTPNPVDVSDDNMEIFIPATEVTDTGVPDGV
jgi:hypothetical protein